MKTLVCRRLAVLLLPLALLCAPQAARAADAVDRMLIILTSPDTETQGMALILANQVAGQGKQLHLLLCGPAGALALKGAPDTKVTTPGGPMAIASLLAGLQAKGAKVDVCALVLPGRQKTAADLKDGIGIAAPPAIAAEMVDSRTRLATF